jgi:hypothetical protein
LWTAGLFIVGIAWVVAGVRAVTTSRQQSSAVAVVAQQQTAISAQSYATQLAQNQATTIARNQATATYAVQATTQAVATSERAAGIATATEQAQATAWAEATGTVAAQATALALQQIQATATAQSQQTAEAQLAATAEAQSVAATAQAKARAQATTLAIQKLTVFDGTWKGNVDRPGNGSPEITFIVKDHTITFIREVFDSCTNDLPYEQKVRIPIQGDSFSWRGQAYNGELTFVVSGKFISGNQSVGTTHYETKGASNTCNDSVEITDGTWQTNKQ